MGSIQFKECIHDINGEEDIQRNRSNKNKSQSIHRTISSPSMEESQYNGVGSQFDNSPMNSFYKDNQIGPFLVEKPIRSTSFINKIQKWRKLLNQGPQQKQQDQQQEQEEYNEKQLQQENESFYQQQQQQQQCCERGQMNDQNKIINKQNIHNQKHVFNNSNNIFKPFSKQLEVDISDDKNTQIKDSKDVEIFSCEDIQTLSTNNNTNETANFIDDDIRKGKSKQEKLKFVNNQLDQRIVSYNIENKQAFKQLLLEGPPIMRLRWSCWKTSLLMDDCDIDLQKFLTDYSPDTEDLIIKDIKRTISQHKFFKSEDQQNTQGHSSLFRLLKGLSNRFPDIGYCQGMNFLAGFMILVSGGIEDQAFGCLVQLFKCQKFMLYHIYSSQLPFLLFLEELTIYMIEQNLPKISQHLKQMQLPNQFWITKMFLSLFLYCFTINTCLRFWDFIFATNIFGSVSIILAFCEIYSNKILNSDMGAFMEWFQNLPENELNVRDIIQVAQEKYKINKRVVAQFALNQKDPNQFVKALQYYHDKSKFQKIYSQMIQDETNQSLKLKSILTPNQ